MKMLIVFTLFAISSPAIFSGLASAAPLLKCNQFWPQFPDQNTNCEEWLGAGFPITIGGSEMHMFHYADGWNNETGQVELLATVADTIRRGVSILNQWFKTPPIYSTLYNEFTDKTYAQVNLIDPSLHQPCRMSLFFNIPNDRSLAEQIAAHEIVHCIQSHDIRYVSSTEEVGNIKSRDWWVEGSATFFAAFPFPAGGLDVGYGNNYNPVLPLYRQTDAYSTIVFFDTLRQHLHLTYPQIGDLLRRQPASSTFASERTALADWPGIDEMYFQFFRHYVDKDIKTVGGLAYTIPSLKFGAPLEIRPEHPNLSLPVTPFTMAATYLIKILPGTTFKVHLDGASAAANKIRVSYREIFTKDWKELKDLSDEIKVDCSNADGGIYQVLLSSTADSATPVDANLVFEFVDIKECYCMQSEQPPDPCLLGNWELDNAALQAFYTKHFGYIYTKIEVSGLYKFHITSKQPSVIEFNSYRIYLLQEYKEGKLESEQIVQGIANQNILMQKKGQMCMRLQSAQGTVMRTFNGKSEISPLEDFYKRDVTLPEDRYNYQCSANKLTFFIDVGEGLVFEWEFNKKP